MDGGDELRPEHIGKIGGNGGEPAAVNGREDAESEEEKSKSRAGVGSRPPYRGGGVRKAMPKSASAGQAAANDAAAYRAAPRVKKMKYVSLRPSLSEDEAQTMRPQTLKSEIRPTKPAPIAAANFFCSPLN